MAVEAHWLAKHPFGKRGFYGQANIHCPSVGDLKGTSFSGQAAAKMAEHLLARQKVPASIPRNPS